ncbi:MAG: dihydrolipoyl dehydrogenase [Actinomycetota bacterium]|nr:dihydrolipoyl dehydrogenase [Actinomycetota bacterium]
MVEASYDCVVIGSGPGGYVAAIRAAQLGMRTAVVERDDVVGGRCLNYACIPAKAVLRVADVLSEIDEAGDYGIEVAGRTVDFTAVAKRRQKVVTTLTGGVSSLFRKNAIEVVRGHGALTSEGAVKVGGDFDGQEIEAATVVLATGSVARPIPGTQFRGRVLETAGAWLLDELPGTLAVVGAGASGAEIASAYGRLGTEVLLLEALDRVLPTEDAEVSKAVGRGLAKQNITVLTDTQVRDVEADDRRVRFSYGEESAEVDYLAIAAGRGADVEALGLDVAGVDVHDSGQVKVDENMRTSRPGVYAIGDLVPGPALAHKASDEGIIAVEAAAGLETHPLIYEDIPRATFCTPNVASFGLTEDQARERGHDVVIGRVPFGAVGAGAVYGDRQGMVKIVGERKYGELLGAHIVGSKATELIQELVNVRLMEGGFSEVAHMIHGHPTLSEAVMEAARAAAGWLIHG